MESIEIDWVAIVVAACVNMVIGSFWYSKWLFGPTWMKLKKIKKIPLSGPKFAVEWGNSFCIAFFLSFFQAHFQTTSVLDSIFLGLLFWFGFVLTTQIQGAMWNRFTTKQLLIDSEFKLFSFLSMSGVIGA